jgi:hypothetical protein
VQKGYIETNKLTVIYQQYLLRLCKRDIKSLNKALIFVHASIYELQSHKIWIMHFNDFLIL